MELTLALGGGGAKGAAHIPVLEALDDLGVRPVSIAGTSVGALVGAAYAGGMSGAELRAHIMSLASRRHWAVFDFLSDRRNLTFWRALDPAAALDTVWPKGLPSRIEDLDIPFAAVVTDYFGHSVEALRSGPLDTAIAASIAIPGVFTPVERDGRLYVDGGLLCNLPVEAAGGGLCLAVDVITPPAPGEVPAGPVATAMGALRIVFHASSEAELARHPDARVLQPPTGGAGPLDVARIDAILATATPVREEAKRLITQMLETAESKPVAD